MGREFWNRRMNEDPVIIALSEQVNCYQRLAKLAALQHIHVQQSQTEQLLEVLKSRQEVLDRISGFESVIAPAKREWSGFVTKLAAPARAKAESLLAESRKLLEQITTADRNDAMVLQQRKLNIGRQIKKSGIARQINRNYAAAAYTTRGSKMDVQR
jgi:hypothetical protein